MDEYTEKLLERTKARREFLKNKKTTEVRKRRTVLSDENQTNLPNSDLQQSNDDSPKRQCLEADGLSYSGQKSYENKENAKKNSNDESSFSCVTPGARGLAALRRNKNSSDETEVKEIINYGGAESKVNTLSEPSTKSQSSHKSRFANLAAQIREWEDDDHPTTTENVPNVNLKTSAPSSQPLPKFFSFSDSNSSFSSSSSSSSSSGTLFINSASNGNVSDDSGVSKHVRFHPDCNKNNLGKHVTHSSVLSHPYARKFESKSNEVLPKSGNCQKVLWDQAILSTLECQGFVKSPSKSKMAYDFAKRSEKMETKESTSEESDEEMDDDRETKLSVADHSPKKEVSTIKCEISQKKEMLKSCKNKSPIKKVDLGNDGPQCNADPADLPLSARKAIFEKAFFGTPPKQDNSVESNLSVAQRAAMFEKAAKGVFPKKVQQEPSKLPSQLKSIDKSNEPTKFPPPANAPARTTLRSERNSPSKNIMSSNTPEFIVGNSCVVSPPKSSPSDMDVTVLSPSKNASPHTRLVQQKLIDNSAKDWRKKDIVAKAADERKNEIAALVNHWEKKVCSSSEYSCSDMDQQPYKSSSTSSETEKYPVFSKPSDEIDNCENDNSSENEDFEEESADYESSEAEYNEEGSRCVPDEEEYVIARRYTSVSDNVPSHIVKDAANVCSTIKEILDEDTGPEVNPMPPPALPSCSSKSSKSASSSSRSSGSSSSQKETSQSQYATPTMNYDSNNDSNPDLPLLHTVSFYRKQKQEKRSTPVRSIVRREQVASPPSPEIDSMKLIQAKIKALEEEIRSHQTIISQASQALNLCHATEEFFGSTEQVEGEKLLLIATQKRQACINEIHRLKTHGALGKTLESGTGSLIMNDIKLPLKRDFIACQLENKDNDAVHYFMCLVRHGHQVILTQMLSTTPREITNGSLCFTNHITLHDLPPDFSIAFEVYALQTKKEVLPHDKKYHIKKEHSKIRLTPKGKKSDSKLLIPAISSPGGPNAVRSPSFGVVGFTRFTLQNCNRKTYTLDKVPFSSPLDGVLLVKLQLHSEHNVTEKGFLTMYEDVSGKGALRRLWCVLDSKELSFWKYPDDEKRKNPIHQIDMSQCISSQIKLLSRDICARSHTFQLLTARPQAEGDKNTLISRKINTLTTTKYMLSADTKEERIMWCKRLNECLMNVRKWDPNALRPVEVKE